MSMALFGWRLWQRRDQPLGICNCVGTTWRTTREFAITAFRTWSSLSRQHTIDRRETLRSTHFQGRPSGTEERGGQSAIAGGKWRRWRSEIERGEEERRSLEAWYMASCGAGAWQLLASIPTRWEHRYGGSDSASAGWSPSCGPPQTSKAEARSSSKLRFHESALNFFNFVLSFLPPK